MEGGCGMKRYMIYSFSVLFSLLLLMTGCRGRTEAYAGKILPSRIENIPDKDIIPDEFRALYDTFKATLGLD